MRVFKTLLFLVLLSGVAGVLLLLALQNADQHVELGLNLGPLGAWRFKEPQPAVLVMLGSFAVGAVLVGLVAVYEVIVFQRRLSRLNQMLQGKQPPSGA